MPVQVPRILKIFTYVTRCLFWFVDIRLWQSQNPKKPYEAEFIFHFFQWNVYQFKKVINKTQRKLFWYPLFKPLNPWACFSSGPWCMYHHFEKSFWLCLMWNESKRSESGLTWRQILTISLSLDWWVGPCPGLPGASRQWQWLWPESSWTHQLLNMKWHFPFERSDNIFWCYDVVACKN